MSIDVGGGQTPITPLNGENGGAYKKNPTQEQFNDELIPASHEIGSAAGALTGAPTFESGKDKSAFDDNDDDKGAHREETPNRANLFHSANLMDLARAFAKHVMGQESKEESHNGNDSEEPTSARNDHHSYKGSSTALQSELPQVAIKTNIDRNADKPLFAGLNDSQANHGNIVKDLTYYPKDERSADTARMLVETKDGPALAQMNPLRAPNGDVVRNQYGQSLIGSMDLTNQNRLTSRVDFTDVALANQSGIAQQGLVLDRETTKLNPGSIILQRQDGAQIAYQFYSTADDPTRPIAGDNVRTQARLSAVASQDGTRYYHYDNNNPSVAKAIIDKTQNSAGVPIVQMRVRDGNSNTFQLHEYQMQYDKPTLVRSETERYVQTRVDGQIVYQLDRSAEIAQRDRAGDYNRGRDLQGRPVSRQELLNELTQDKTNLVANDLPSSKRALLEATKGRLFGGNDAKTSNYIDMFITRIHEQREMGNHTATDDQVAASLRQVASVFTTARSGTAAQMSDAMLNRQTEDMLKSMGNPIRENNQGQIGSCYVNSYRIVAEYAYPHMVLEKWASIMSTGQTKDGKAKFSTKELNTKSFRGTTPFDYIMTSACWKKRVGATKLLGGMSSGTHDGQAIPEYKWLTGGGKLPHSQAEAKRLKIGAWIFFQPGHARTKVQVKKSGSNQTMIFANNTWDGSGESQKEPTQNVVAVNC